MSLLKHKEEGKYLIHAFSSWGGFVDFLEKTPREPKTGRASEERGGSFTGTNSFEEAISLAKDGWKEGKDKILKGKKELFDSSDLFRKPAFYKSVAGSFPSVPSYVANQPKSMYRRVRRETNIPILEIHVCPNGLANVEKQAFINYGGYLLNFIEQQENEGRRTELHVTYHNTVDGGKGNVTTVELKKSGEFADVDFLSFALAHPSSLRRLEFAMMERSPFKQVRSSTQCGYGSTNQNRPPFLQDEAIWLGAVESEYEDKETCISVMDNIVEKELKRIGML